MAHLGGKVKLAILGGGSGDYNALDQKLNELIEEKQCYLFTVLCGATDPEKYTPGLSEVWAKKNGAPIEYLIDADPQRLLKKLAAAADYIIFILRDEQWLKNFMMQYKMLGKHGTVIKL